MACVVERTLGHRNPREERDECGERRDDEEQSPLASALNDENPPEGDREEEPDRPEEVQQDHESSARLGREELREQRRVDDENSAEAESREQPGSEDAPRIPCQGPEPGEERGPKDTRQENHPAAPRLGEATTNETTD